MDCSQDVSPRPAGCLFASGWLGIGRKRRNVRASRTGSITGTRPQRHVTNLSDSPNKERSAFLLPGQYELTLDASRGIGITFNLVRGRARVAEFVQMDADPLGLLAHHIGLGDTLVAVNGIILSLAHDGEVLEVLKGITKLRQGLVVLRFRHGVGGQFPGLDSGKVWTPVQDNPQDGLESLEVMQGVPNTGLLNTAGNSHTGNITSLSVQAPRSPELGQPELIWNVEGQAHVLGRDLQVLQIMQCSARESHFLEGRGRSTLVAQPLRVPFSERMQQLACQAAAMSGSGSTTVAADERCVSIDLEVCRDAVDAELDRAGCLLDQKMYLAQAEHRRRHRARHCGSTIDTTLLAQQAGTGAARERASVSLQAISGHEIAYELVSLVDYKALDRPLSALREDAYDVDAATDRIHTVTAHTLRQLQELGSDQVLTKRSGSFWGAATPGASARPAWPPLHLTYALAMTVSLQLVHSMSTRLVPLMQEWLGCFQPGPHTGRNEVWRRLPLRAEQEPERFMDHKLRTVVCDLVTMFLQMHICRGYLVSVEPVGASMTGESGRIRLTTSWFADTQSAAPALEQWDEERVCIFIASHGLCLDLDAVAEACNAQEMAAALQAIVAMAAAGKAFQLVHRKLQQLLHRGAQGTAAIIQAVQDILLGDSRGVNASTELTDQTLSLCIMLHNLKHLFYWSVSGAALMCAELFPRLRPWNVWEVLYGNPQWTLTLPDPMGMQQLAGDSGHSVEATRLRQDVAYHAYVSWLFELHGDVCRSDRRLVHTAVELSLRLHWRVGVAPPAHPIGSLGSMVMGELGWPGASERDDLSSAHAAAGVPAPEDSAEQASRESAGVQQPGAPDCTVASAAATALQPDLLSGSPVLVDRVVQSWVCAPDTYRLDPLWLLQALREHQHWLGVLAVCRALLWPSPGGLKEWNPGSHGLSPQARQGALDALEAACLEAVRNGSRAVLCDGLRTLWHMEEGQAGSAGVQQSVGSKATHPVFLSTLRRLASFALGEQTDAEVSPHEPALPPESRAAKMDLKDIAECCRESAGPVWLASALEVLPDVLGHLDIEFFCRWTCSDRS